MLGEVSIVMRIFNRRTVLLSSIVLLLILFSGGKKIESADHADAPILGTIGRNDAKITDLYAFTDRNQMVIVLCTNPAIPPSVTDYTFQDDVTFEINIDNSSIVSHQDQTANEIYGGTVVEPAGIEADIKFAITFKNGRPKLQATGLIPNANAVTVFAGLRDDPFIRGPRIGRNIAAIVLKMPLPFVMRNRPDLLIWAASRVPELNNIQSDLAGRALRSMFNENALMNELPPNQHFQSMGVPPDVLIITPASPPRFPNGRALTDDVVDLVGDTRVLGNDAPFPSANDVPFLNKFPYLAPPQ